MFIHDIIKMEYVRQGYLPNFPYHLISNKEMFDAFIVFELEVPKEDALKVIQNDITLWDNPKSFVSSHQLQSFNISVTASGEPVLVIRGGNHSLKAFNEVLGLDKEIRLSDMCYFSTKYPCPYESVKESYDLLVQEICYHIDAYLYPDSSILTPAVPDWVYTYMLGAVIAASSPSIDRHDLLKLLNIDNLNDELDETAIESCLSISKKWVDKLPPSKNNHRPPTVFGEPHVIKSLRVMGLAYTEPTK